MVFCFSAALYKRHVLLILASQSDNKTTMKHNHGKGHTCSSFSSSLQDQISPDGGVMMQIGPTPCDNSNNNNNQENVYGAVIVADSHCECWINSAG